MNAMNPELLLRWLLPAVFVLVGIGLLFAKTNREKLRAQTHANPMLALYRFSFFRYGAAGALFIAAAVAYVALK